MALVRKALGLVQAFPTSRTPPSDLLKLIRQLYPIDPGLPLIRLGPDGDGGYLVPDDLEGIEACFSPGVSHTSGFEQDCSRRGMRVFLADASVDKPAISDVNFAFIKQHIGAVSIPPFTPLESWAGSACPGPGDLLLQMDIEGSEYETLLSAPDALLRRFRIIVIEFHDLELLWSRPWYGLVSRAFEKLLQTHVCVHNHPNNGFKPFKMGKLAIPSLLEMTFLRRDRLKKSTPVLRFPHPLDRDNTPHPSYSLPDCWYQHSLPAASNQSTGA